MTEPSEQMETLRSGQPSWPEASVFPARGLTEAELAIEPTARVFPGSDGFPLAVLSWRSVVRPALATVVVLHGVQSHAGWYHGLGRRLAAAGFDAVFPDRRGSGANQSMRGHARSSRQLVADVAVLLAAVPGPRVVAGISWGGKLAVAVAAKRPDLVDGVALLCPGLTPRVGVSPAEKRGVALAKITGRAATTRFPVPLADPALFTADPEAQRFIAGDPLSLREATAGLLATSFFLDQRVRRAARRLHQPILLMLGGQDRIVDNDRTRAYLDRVASTRKSLIEYPEAHHTLEFEPDPARSARDLVAWLNAEVACSRA
jgi:alpha-beta hydrolase superfamily lysophospholipase